MQWSVVEGLQVVQMGYALLFLLTGVVLGGVTSGLIRGLLTKTHLDNKFFKTLMGEDVAKTVDIESVLSKMAGGVVVLYFVIAAFEALGMREVVAPLSLVLSDVFGYGTRIVGAVLLVFVAWVIAIVAKRLVAIILSKTRIDNLVKEEIGFKDVPLSKAMSELVYWLVFLLILPNILQVLQLGVLLVPVQNLLTVMLGYIPNLTGAGLILFVGWVVATVVRRITVKFVQSFAIDGLPKKLGLGSLLGNYKLSSLIGVTVYLLILVPIFVSALEALKIEAVSRPAIAMLEVLMLSVPRMLGVVVIVLATLVLAKVISGLVEKWLKAIDFDRFMENIGLTNVVDNSKLKSPSQVVGYVITGLLVLFALIESANVLELNLVAGILSDLLRYSGGILGSVVLLMIGAWFIGRVSNLVTGSSVKNAKLLGVFVRVILWIVVIAMVLEEVGVGQQILTLAFGLILAGLALGFALAVGLGARDHVGKLVGEWIEDWRLEKMRVDKLLFLTNTYI